MVTDLDRTQVLVVGAGPAGLVAGITLARHGVRVVVAEKRSEISALPRALVISTRSMEILRAWGLEDAVRAGAADVEPCGWVADTFVSADGAEIPLGYPKTTDTEVSPTRPAWAPQDHLEPILLARLRGHPSARIRFGCELIDLEQHVDGVRARLRVQSTGATTQVHALFVIGADGARSTVRTLLGIGMQGQDQLAEYHSVQFRAPLHTIRPDRRYGLTVITHPDAAGVLAPQGPGDRWHYAREWRPGQPRLLDLPHPRLATLIATATGVPDLRPAIVRVSGFRFAAQIADRYRERRGFLVGDAAHRMTPRGGTGMNTAIHDAYDLAWKLGWLLRGWAEPDLLDSYERERRPVGLHNVQRSADPAGARQTAGQALPWDLGERLPHHWLPNRNRRLSTLDLIGDGLTLLAGPGDDRWLNTASELTTRAPVTNHVLDAATARLLGIPRGGAALYRPDGRRLRHRLVLVPHEPASPP